MGLQAPASSVTMLNASDTTAKANAKEPAVMPPRFSHNLPAFDDEDGPRIDLFDDALEDIERSRRAAESAAAETRSLRESSEASLEEAKASRDATEKLLGEYRESSAKSAQLARIAVWVSVASLILAFISFAAQYNLW